MKIKDVKREAQERFAINRYHAMLVHGVLYTLAFNIAVIGIVFFAFKWYLALYGLVLALIFFLLQAPVQFSLADFYLKSFRMEKVDAFHIFDGFNKYNLERVIKLHLIRTGMTLLWTLCLIVPGIIYQIRSSMAVYLLKANPKMKPSQALRASNKLMRGHSGDYFRLSLSFVGWYLLSIVSLGMGFIWVLPYFDFSKVTFYKREIQGDKTVYKSPEEEEDEDDEKNVAKKLIKLQLSQEIENIDKKIISKDKLNKQSNSLSNSKSKEPSPNEFSHEPPSALDNFAQSITSDEKPFDEEIVTVNKLIKEVPLPAMPTKQNVKPQTVQLEKAAQQANEAAQSAKKSSAAFTTIDLPAREEKPSLEMETLAEAAHDPKDDIKKKLEEIKLQREMRRVNLTRPVKPAPQAKPAAPTKTVTYDPEFAPEKLDIEIEEDHE